MLPLLEQFFDILVESLYKTCDVKNLIEGKEYGTYLSINTLETIQNLWIRWCHTWRNIWRSTSS